LKSFFLLLEVPEVFVGADENKTSVNHPNQSESTILLCSLEFWTIDRKNKTKIFLLFEIKGDIRVNGVMDRIDLHSLFEEVTVLRCSSFKVKGWLIQGIAL
jgi:hypothetical protein